MKHVLRILTVIIVLSGMGPSAVAQTATSNKAKAYYFQAEKAFNEQDYASAFKKLSEAETLLGAPNPSTLAMKVKIFYAQDNLRAAKAAIEDFYGMDAGPNLAREMSDYLIKIDDDIQAEKDRVENARLTAIKAEEEAAAKASADAKASVVRNKEGCENKVYADCFSYGLQFYNGTTASPQNYDTAAKYFGKSCEYQNENQGRSCNLLGNMYEKMYYTPDSKNDYLVFGLSGERLDKASSEAILTNKAFYLYKRSCLVGYEYGCYNVGRMYETGYGDIENQLLMPDSFRARTFHQKACKLGVTKACKAANEVRADKAEASFQTNKPLCDKHDDLSACSIVARAYKDGAGTEREWTKASVYFSKVAPHLKATCLVQPPNPDGADACYLYARFKNEVPHYQSFPLAYQNYAFPVEWQPIVAHEYYELACAKQHVEACEDLEYLPRKTAGVIRPIITDCDKGDGDACLLLGLAYFNGQLANETMKVAKSTPYFQKGCLAIKKNEKSCRLYQDAIAK